MKIKSFMMMMVAAATVVLGFTSCGSDDDEPEVAVATQVAGSYTGNEVVVVMGEESSNETKTYVFTKVLDTAVDLTIPEIGMGGKMSIPALFVKNIPLKKNGNTISGNLASYTGSVTNADGVEKAFSITNLVILVDGKNIAVTYSLKYGNMPMLMETTFTGTKK